MGFLEVLTLIFVVLKLLNIIHWSWLAVLSPIWLTVGVVFILITFGAILKDID